MNYPVDWINFLPAIQMFWRGGNPYTVGEGFSRVYEPFWTYIILTPIAAMPFHIGRALLFLVSLITFAYSAHRMGAKKWQVVMFLLSYPVLGCLYEGNIDWLVTAGLWMPPQLGLFFVLMKPQIGLGVAIYWAYDAWFTGGWKYMMERVAPVTLLYTISFIVYGLWIFRFGDMSSNPGNWGLFPVTVPIGLVLFYLSFYLFAKRLSILGTPLISPYASPYNFSGFLLALFHQRDRVFILAWIAFWIPAVVRAIIT